MTDKMPYEKELFEISVADAIRIIDGLELAASWDKTEIYYKLKDWLENEKKSNG